MSNRLILVTGATGKTGRRVASGLHERGFAVRAVSRTSQVPFDWSDVSTWGDALGGVRSVYIVHPGLGSDGAAEQVRAFAEAAATAGVARAVLASTPDDGSPFSRSMRAAERGIVDAGLQLTSLRLRWFHQNFSEDFLLPPVLAGELRLPAGTGREAFVDADDIAEVAIAALTDDRHAGAFYEVTGPRLLRFAEIAEAISRGTGHSVRYVPVDPEVFVAEQIALGVPADWAYGLCAIYQDIAHGKLETVSGDVEAVLGKPARDFSAYVARMAADGVWHGATAG